ncbi:Sugar transporter 12 [Operophtera brumata]|uniref:Sugar transporter 12 n=1 Tax=Operophtera brumata TaxID=104452 RepID=A0A0L7L2W9_OPEBR|nr:Sugar transporter 12 [Operophtera brumata]
MIISFIPTVCSLCMCMGVMFAWPSSTLRLFESANTTLHRPMTEGELALFGSLSSVGALIGTPVLGMFLDRFGRKNSAILSWALIVSSNQVEVVLLAVFVSGLSGAVFLVVPVYVSEICQESIRGAMCSGTMVFYGVGMLLSYLMGGLLSYDVMIYACLTLAAASTAMLSVLRESPTCLMAKGLEETDSKEVLEELNNIRRSLNPEMDEKSSSTRRALYLTLTLITASIFQGLVVVQVYAEPLFEEAIPSMSPTVCSILLAVVVVVSGLVAAYLTESAGRRVSLLTVHTPHDIRIIRDGGLLPASRSSAPPEVGPQLADSGHHVPLHNEWAWFCNSIILFIFNPLLKAIGLGPVFYIFAAVSVLTGVYCVIMLPETKGLATDEIQNKLTKRKICSLCMCLGVMFAWPSSTLHLFESANTTLHRPMTEGELALFGSLSSVGALIGTPVLGMFLDRFGRKNSAIIASTLGVLSWALIAFSNQVEIVLLAVFVSGLSGVSFLVVPVYVSEICQESIRGAMCSGFMVFYGLGMLLSYLMGGLLSYDVMIYISLTIAAATTAMLLEAARSIAFYRSLKTDSKEVLEELNNIRRSLNPDMDVMRNKNHRRTTIDTNKIADLLVSSCFTETSSSTRRALYLTLTLITVSIFQGLVVVQVYAEPLFEEAIPSMSPTVCSILLAVVVVVSGLVAAYLTESAGRRVSLLTIHKWAWFCNSIILFIFNPLLKAIGLGPVFYIFAAVSVLTGVYCVIMLPETKGLAIDEIQSKLTKRKSKKNDLY